MLALTMAFGLLTGCGGKAEEKTAFESWRQSYAAAETHEMQAVITASDDTRACEYTLHYTQDSEGETVEVLSPETVAKVKATVKDDGARLEYDGVALDTGTTLEGRLSPVMALPTLSRFLKDGHIENLWTEKRDGESFQVTELENNDGARLRFWQAADGTPVYAELRSGERVEIKMNLTKFS
ncbi:MAG: hypothetical protein ACOX66_03630 [Oscillospiraceae bacterium]|jgi:hypothetical protein